jgi:hypothetical protein
MQTNQLELIIIFLRRPWYTSDSVATHSEDLVENAKSHV